MPKKNSPEQNAFSKLKDVKIAAPEKKVAVVKKVSNVASDQTFEQAMHGVKPLKGKALPFVPKTKAAEIIKDNTDDKEALEELKRLVSGKGDDVNFRMSSDETSSGHAPGVNFDLLGRLKKGQFAYTKSLDLHGLLQNVAHDAVMHFIKEARLNNERCVLIITGKGLGSPNGIGVLRDALPQWLSTAPLNQHVLAFTPAKPKDGGPGAFYVLLRK